MERLGNKKSRVVVAALNEYIQNHPGILEDSISEKANPNDISRAYLEQIILDLLKKYHSVEYTPEQDIGSKDESVTDLVNQDIIRCFRHIIDRIHKRF